MRKKIFFILFLCVAITNISSLFGLFNNFENSNIYFPSKGKVSFISNAPLEVIKAESEDIIGAINIEKSSFAFEVSLRSFEGFNSPLQKEHFNENYVESDKYPKATFAGKIIEDINLNKDGTYPVRAKGILSVHGIPAERIIKATIEVLNGEIIVHSGFKISLTDHKIKVPAIVNQKISEIIDVDLKILLKPKK
jgi:hypothetical protein